MKKIFVGLVLFASALFSSELEINDIFVKQTAPNARATAVFLKITNNSDKDIDLLGAKSDLSDRIELHTHITKGKKVLMTPISKITIPARSSVELKPGGEHIMLFNIKNQIKADTKISLTLEFSNGESLNFGEIESKEVPKPPKKQRVK